MQAITIQTFPGLDLARDPAEARGAIDLRNIDCSDPTTLKTRPGLSRLGSSIGADVPTRLFVAGEYLYYTTTGGDVRLFTVTFTTSNLGTLNSTFAEPAALGTPTDSRVFFPQGTFRLQVSVNLAALANTTTACKPWYVGVTPIDNRLVQGNYSAAADSPSGANGSPSTVFFSDPGAPDTYGANNYVHLHPGDGEQINGIVTWREMTFVFKSTKVFVFTTTGIDGSGNPVFNWRTVNLSAPLAGADLLDARPMCAGPDGVYFATRTGIFRTNGGPPALVSAPVTPIFDKTAPSAIQFASTSAKLAWAAGHLFFTYASGTGAYLTLVRAPSDQWSLWSTSTTGLRPIVEWAPRTGSPRAGYRTIVTGQSGEMQCFDASVTADGDAATAISSYYQSGWSDYGTTNRKRLRRLTLWGSGTPTVSVFADRGSTDASAGAVTLGTAPAIARARQVKARVGREFSWKVAQTSGVFDVSSLELYLADQRVS